MLPRGRGALLLKLLLRRREFEPRSFVAGVHAPLPLATVLLRDLYKLGVGRAALERRRQVPVAVETDRILYHLRELRKSSHCVSLGAEVLFEVHVVIEVEVFLHETRAVRVVQRLLECVDEQVQLEADVEQSPILVLIIGIERLASPHVVYVLDREYIKLLHVELFVLVANFLFKLLALHRVFPLPLLHLPSLNLLLPRGPSLREPRRDRQVVYLLRLLLLEHEVPHDRLRLRLWLPLVADVVETLGIEGQ
mmetsp:Transcript_77630/g.215710  ORF Transcript_77630/g.215710 Transcript_77630/m.215710 type:complete len:251 (+) Transcript_77630:277-1029(+)